MSEQPSREHQEAMIIAITVDRIYNMVMKGELADLRDHVASKENLDRLDDDTIHNMYEYLTGGTIHD